MKPKQPSKVPRTRWRTFFVEELRELYRNEKRWMIILPEVARNMPARQVEEAVVQHLEQTAAKVIQLEEIFKSVAAVSREESRAIEPILREAGYVLTAVTRSTAAARKQAVARAFIPEETSGSRDAFFRN